MKRIFLPTLKRRFALTALLIAAQLGRAQTWIQWSSFEGGNNHYYALTPAATNWTAAQKLAVSWGGTLATVTSSNEQNFINRTFLTGKFEHLPVWIGLVDPPKKGFSFSGKLGPVEVRIGGPPKVNFRWVTGERLAYNNWHPNQPDNCSPGENYTAMNWHYSDHPPRGIKGDWNDAPLNGTTGFGGKTDGPYFGLVERDTDPSQPLPSSFIRPAAYIGLSMVLVALLIVYFARFKRKRVTA